MPHGSKPEHHSIPSDDFRNAVGQYSRTVLSEEWKKGTTQNSMQVWEITKAEVYDFHLTAIRDGTGWNVTKFHFTLRKGPGKGKDAFAWFEIQGLNKAAVLLERKDQGDVAMFADQNLPLNIRTHVANINQYAKDIFSLAKSFIKKD